MLDYLTGNLTLRQSMKRAGEDASHIRSLLAERLGVDRRSLICCRLGFSSIGLAVNRRLAITSYGGNHTVFSLRKASSIANNL